ncbi:hypothetical protein ACMDCR_00420 [Labrys okinawensis]|uniref:hypothetical protein n=1 Tax=Labrys okinawensis TaxID=346911 RepID=UPI0039BCF3B1
MSSMSDEKARFPIGTIVVLATGSEATKPPFFRPGDDLIMESATSGKTSCRITTISPEMIEVTSATTRYSLTPTAATLAEGGISTYEGGWIVRSLAES